MLSEMKINDYIDLLASDAPAPGGAPQGGVDDISDIL